MSIGGDLSFLESFYLLFLVVPALFVILWIWRLIVRRVEVANYHKRRSLPVKERFTFLGQLASVFFLILAAASAVLALSRPAKTLSVKNNAAVDLIIIQDGSASMNTPDSKPNRWQRSQSFLRALTESLRWNGDRLALAAFASKAAPFIRLTSDPNVVMFFLDHLGKESPFKLEDDKTWDSNAEEGIYWGVMLLAKDRSLYGPSKNPQAFVLVSDGQDWTGSMETIFKIVRNIAPVYVVGVGTSSGGIIPEPKKTYLGTESEKPPVPTHSSIDRSSLRKIAATTGGGYFELDTEPDSQIALKIVTKVSNSKIITDDKKENVFQELYWYCLVLTAVCLAGSIGYLYRF